MRSLMMRCALLVLGLVASAASPARADISLTMDATAFNALVTGGQTITFEGYAPVNGYIDYGHSLTIGGVTFTSDNPYVYVIDPGYSGNYYTLGSGQALDDFYGTTSVTLQPGTTAVGFDFAANSGSTITVTDAGGDTYTATAPATNFQYPGPQPYEFFGFTASTAITSVTYTKPNYGLAVLDNFVTGQADSVVPEPSTLVSASIAGLFGLGYAWRRHRRAKRVA